MLNLNQHLAWGWGLWRKEEGVCEAEVMRRCSGRGCHEGVLRGPDDVMRRGFSSKGIRTNETQTHSFLFWQWLWSKTPFSTNGTYVSPLLGERPAFLQKWFDMIQWIHGIKIITQKYFSFPIFLIDITPHDSYRLHYRRTWSELTFALWNATLSYCMLRNPHVILIVVPLTTIYEDINRSLWYVWIKKMQQWNKLRKLFAVGFPL